MPNARRNTRSAKLYFSSYVNGQTFKHLNIWYKQKYMILHIRWLRVIISLLEKGLIMTAKSVERVLSTDFPQIYRQNGGVKVCQKITMGITMEVRLTCFDRWHLYRRKFRQYYEFIKKNKILKNPVFMVSMHKIWLFWL